MICCLIYEDIVVHLTLYVILLFQALNSAGAGAFSSVCSCQTPPSSPGPVVLLRPHATANSIHIMWKEPNANGSKITQYNLDIGERHLITVEKALEYEILDLLPETTYKSVSAQVSLMSRFMLQPSSL